MRSEEQSGAGGAGAVALPPELAAAAGAGAPHIAQVNVSRNSRMHIGPQFVSVTQTVHQDRVVKGRVFGLWLETRGGAGAGAEGARRLRCSVAVFVCWALIVAVALAVYVGRRALASSPHRIDLEVGVWRVAWTWVRATSRGERLACAAALLALALCAVVAGVLAAPRAPAAPPDPAPHEWNITRKMWLAGPHAGDEESWAAQFLPLRLVVVQHTVGFECHRFADCAALMRNLQSYYFREYHYDLPYNFVMGNEARVYEGRGARLVGAHTRGYNRCALGLAFAGNYRNGTGGSVPTAEQLGRARALLAAGVRAGWLHARHAVLGARDVQDTASPGDALYAALRRWPEAPADPARFRARSCIDIYAELSALDDAPATATATADPPSSQQPHY